MKLLLQIKNLLNGRVDSAFYEENRVELDKTNFGLLRTATLFATGMCLFLFCMTLINPLIAGLNVFYFIYTFYFAVLATLVLTVVSRKRRLLPLFFYLFAGAIFVLVIDVGTRVTPELPAVTFFVFLLIIPVLFVSKPLYSVLLSVIACTAFCVVTLLVKGVGSYLSQTDVLNAVCCCIVGIGFDLTIINLQLENIRSKTYFKRQSATDELTELPNRRSFDVFMERTFDQSREQNQNLYALMMDIDDFKAYNDTYGHVAGDECLRQVGWALKRAAQAQGVFLARFGGEEFVAAIVLEGGEDPQQIADTLVNSVAQLKIEHQGSSRGQITISAGFAGLRDSKVHDYRNLLDCADHALYTAKALGKNQARNWVAFKDIRSARS